MSTDYSDFNAAEFLKARFTLEDSNPRRGCLCNTLDFMYRFFRDYGSQHFDTTKTKLVEIGGGPSIMNLICAVPYVSEIVFTDFASSSLEQVDLWKKNSPLAFDWNPFFEHVADKEGLSAPEVAERKTKLRVKLSKICSCDLTRETVIDQQVVPQGGFDILITCCAIESVAKSQADIFVMLQRCSDLLAPGGFMVLVMYNSRSPTYKVSAQDAKLLHVFCGANEEMLRSGLKQAGLRVDVFEVKKGFESKTAEIEASYRLVARKMEIN